MEDFRPTRLLPFSETAVETHFPRSKVQTQYRQLLRALGTDFESLRRLLLSLPHINNMDALVAQKRRLRAKIDRTVLLVEGWELGFIGRVFLYGLRARIETVLEELLVAAEEPLGGVRDDMDVTAAQLEDLEDKILAELASF